MVYIIVPNATDADHLAAVKAVMVERGAPVIRCVRDDAAGVIVALEGSHRLSAAHELGMAPILEILDHDEMLTCEEIGYDDCGWFEGEQTTAWSIVERIGEPMGAYHGCPQIKFEEVVEA